MVTVASRNVNKTTPRARIAIQVDPRDYWDETNKRWKSGNIEFNISSVTLTGTKPSGENVTLCLSPAVFDEACNDKMNQNCATNATISLAMYHELAINYGQPGPSAVREADGGYSALYLDISLDNDIASAADFYATINYTKTFTEVNAYGAMTGETVRSETLYLKSHSKDSWGAIAFENLDDSSIGFLAVQLKSVTTTVFPDNLSIETPIFQFSCDPQESGQQLNFLNYQMPGLENNLKVFKDSFTWVFAYNNGKIDANGRKVSLPNGTGYTYVTHNYGLVRNDKDSSKQNCDVVLSFSTLQILS